MWGDSLLDVCVAINLRYLKIPEFAEISRIKNYFTESKYVLFWLKSKEEPATTDSEVTAANEEDEERYYGDDDGEDNEEDDDDGDDKEDEVFFDSNYFMRGPLKERNFLNVELFF